MSQMCEYEGCTEIAEGFIEAQWSLCDFLRYEGCWPHLFLMNKELSEREVEDFGKPRVYVSSYW